MLVSIIWCCIIWWWCCSAEDLLIGLVISSNSLLLGLWPSNLCADCLETGIGIGPDAGIECYATVFQPTVLSLLWLDSALLQLPHEHDSYWGVCSHVPADETQLWVCSSQELHTSSLAGRSRIVILVSRNILGVTLSWRLCRITLHSQNDDIKKTVLRAESLYSGRWSAICTRRWSV